MSACAIKVITQKTGFMIFILAELLLLLLLLLRWIFQHRMNCMPRRAQKHARNILLPNKISALLSRECRFILAGINRFAWTVSRLMNLLQTKISDNSRWKWQIIISLCIAMRDNFTKKKKKVWNVGWLEWSFVVLLFFWYQKVKKNEKSSRTLSCCVIWSRR